VSKPAEECNSRLLLLYAFEVTSHLEYLISSYMCSKTIAAFVIRRIQFHAISALQGDMEIHLLSANTMLAWHRVSVLCGQHAVENMHFH